MNTDNLLRDQRIRERAYRLWQQDGSPTGRDLEYWERARELIAMEESAGAGLLPNPASNSTKISAQAGVEEAEIQENYGEFPGLTDQGETLPSPMPGGSKRARRRARQRDSHE